MVAEHAFIILFACLANWSIHCKSSQSSWKPAKWQCYHGIVWQGLELWFQDHICYMRPDLLWNFNMYGICIHMLSFIGYFHWCRRMYLECPWKWTVAEVPVLQAKWSDSKWQKLRFRIFPSTTSDIYHITKSLCWSLPLLLEYLFDDFETCTQISCHTVFSHSPFHLHVCLRSVYRLCEVPGIIMETSITHP